MSNVDELRIGVCIEAAERLGRAAASAGWSIHADTMGQRTALKGSQRELRAAIRAYLWRIAEVRDDFAEEELFEKIMSEVAS